ncbi:putative reverse transcriptase zinc-binding domain-containing protein [Helianthus anomalus]
MREFWRNAWAPPRCNFLLCRAVMGKLASKKGLESRGRGLPDTTCSRCGFAYKDLDHIFASCIWSTSLWWNVFVWLRLKRLARYDTLKEILADLLENPGSKVWKRLVYTIATTTTWWIWLARNVKVFEDPFVPVARSMELIKEDAYTWVCNRVKITSPSWEKWVLLDVADIV